MGGGISTYGGAYLDPVYSKRDPAATDNSYRIGQKWINQSVIPAKEFTLLYVTPTPPYTATWQEGSGGGIKKVINVPADFPTLAEVEPGWSYTIGTNVTDNDPTKTNTGLSFLAGEEIFWTGSTWGKYGPDALWLDDGAALKPVLTRQLGIDEVVRKTAVLPNGIIIDKGAASEVNTFQLTTAPTILRVDKNRADTYTENGSEARPFKTIAAAVAYAETLTPSYNNPVAIVIAPGEYAEAVTVKYHGIHLYGFGQYVTRILRAGNCLTILDNGVDPEPWDMKVVGISIRSSNADYSVIVQGVAGSSLAGNELQFRDCSIGGTNSIHSNIVNYIDFQNTYVMGKQLYEQTSGIWCEDSESGGEIVVDWNNAGTKPSAGSHCGINFVRHLPRGTVTLLNSGAVGEDVRPVPSAATKVFYVDGNRTDDYAQNGSNARPFKTIAAAVAVATSLSLIKVVPKAGGYVEDVALPDGVSIEGYGANHAIISGNLTMVGSAPRSLRYMQFTGAGKSVTITASATVMDCYSRNAVVVNDVVVSARDFHITPPTGVVPLTMSGANSKFQIDLSTIQSIGNVPAVAQSGGMFLSTRTQIVGSRAAGYIFDSTGGFANLINTYVLNMGGGPAINLQNGGIATSPNGIVGVLTVGNVVCGAAHVVVEGLTQVTGTLTGTNLMLRPASLLRNDSGVPGATVKDALNALLSSGGGVIVENDDVDTGTEVVDSFADTTGKSCRWDIVISKGAVRRACSITAAWDASTDAIGDSGEYAVVAVGDSSDVTLSVDIDSNNVRLLATAASDDWAVKAHRVVL